MTNLVIIRTNQVIFMTNQVIVFNTPVVLGLKSITFIQNPVILRSNQIDL